MTCCVVGYLSIVPKFSEHWALSIRKFNFLIKNIFVLIRNFVPRFQLYVWF